MAAIDLSEKRHVPYIWAITGVGTTLQEVKLPRWACRVMVFGSAAAWVKLPSDVANPVDGAAPGLHKQGVPADTNAVFVIRGPDNKPIIPGLITATSIFVAAQSGTATITLTIEAGRQ